MEVLCVVPSLNVLVSFENILQLFLTMFFVCLLVCFLVLCFVVVKCFKQLSHSTYKGTPNRILVYSPACPSYNKFLIISTTDMQCES